MRTPQPREILGGIILAALFYAAFVAGVNTGGPVAVQEIRTCPAPLKH